MNPNNLTIIDWEALKERFMSELKPDLSTPVAIRIENTMFTSARYSGGMKYNGETYTYLEPVIPGKPANLDGSPYVAWLMVRDDFLKWVTRQKRCEKNRGAE